MIKQEIEQKINWNYVEGENTMMRKIVDDIKDMGMWELAQNCIFVKDGCVWYRDFSEEISLLDLMRKLIKHYIPDENIDNMSDEQLDEMITEDYASYADWSDISFVLAVFYTISCGLANVREWLKEYEKEGKV